MFPFWEKVVAPVLEAAEVRRLVEVGALRGENTRQILDLLGPEAELHVIDPVPDFDPVEHAKQFGGQYVFHRALSVDVLGELPAMDAALLDGDHNWYTIYNELKLLAQVSRANDRHLPVCVMHDVAWPYGRRDLYYDPDNVPAEHRQEWLRKGMRPGVRRLVPIGGLNPTMANAVMEGGPRNGVMTGVDDFIAEYDRPLRLVFLPIYFGLAIVVEEAQLDQQPALRAFLDHLETSEGKDMLLELAESMRIDAMLFQHRIYFQNEETIEALAARYLETVKRGLTNEFHLENEARIAHLADCASKPRPVELPRLRDPERHDTEMMRRLRQQRRTGEVPADGPVPSAYSYAPLGRPALDNLQASLETVRADHIRGDLVSVGEGRGGAAILGRAYLEAHAMKAPAVWVAGRFRAAADDRNAPDAADGYADLRPDLNQVRDAFERFDVLDDRVHFLQGDLEATLPDAPIESIAVLHLGSDLGASARTALDHLYPRLAVGGFVVVDEADGPVAEAVEAYRAQHGIAEQPTRVAPAGLTWRKTVEGGVAPAAPAAVAAGASRSPLAVPPASGTRDLSVVVVFHNMAREATRTLHSLSRAYQEGVEGLDYEVIVVDNGSDPDERLTEEVVRSFGPEFRFLDLGNEATPSPANALNRGIRESVGNAVALMVDGAHVVTPGVLHHAMTGLAAYEPAVVAVQPWYVGPGQQGEAMRNGYDQEVEDALFDRIEWPGDGYRLFEIGHFQGDRDWLDGLWESNFLVVPRKLLEQAGGYDEGFDSPGGGYTNLDIYERIGATPGVQLVSLLGEGSFHQVHGGTTTNQADPTERKEKVFAFGERYAELRGRPYSGPQKQIHYVGHFHGDASRRTRARRMTASAFDVDDLIEGIDGKARKALPVPDDLREGFVAAYHRSLAHRHTSWLGRSAINAPTDLLAYQEIIHRVRPDWIIETGTNGGGRAQFLASILDLVGHGRVLSIDSRHFDDLPEHPRVMYLEGRAHDDEVLDRVRAIVGADGADANAFVILGTRGAQRRMAREFEAYSPFVPVGSYVVMEHTVLNGYPVDASFGPGPFEAVRRIMNLRGDFAPDSTLERHALTFNPGGFLKRTS